MTEGQTDRRTIGRTDESDFIGRCRLTSRKKKKKVSETIGNNYSTTKVNRELKHWLKINYYKTLKKFHELFTTLRQTEIVRSGKNSTTPLHDENAKRETFSDKKM